MQTITKHKRYNKLLPIHKEKKLTKVLKKSQILDLILTVLKQSHRIKGKYKQKIKGKYNHHKTDVSTNIDYQFKR